MMSKGFPDYGRRLVIKYGDYGQNKQQRIDDVDVLGWILGEMIELLQGDYVLK